MTNLSEIEKPDPNDDCELCEGTGEVATRDGDYVGCPACMSRDHERQTKDLQSKLATAEGLIALQLEQIAEWQRKVGELQRQVQERETEIYRLCDELKAREGGNHD